MGWMRFSERHGFRPIRSVIQSNSLDEPLRNGLWDILLQRVLRVADVPAFPNKGRINLTFYQIVWSEFFKQRADQFDDHYTLRHIEQLCFDDSEDGWYGIYDFMEFCLDRFDLIALMHNGSRQDFVSECNACLEREMSAFRIVGNEVTAITSEEEIAALEEASSLSAQFEPVAIHLRRSVELLSDRNTPDYRNSIKEAISAVESMCQLISGKPKATLGDTLKQLAANGIGIHPALREAISRLYGYTSDAQGIRQALMEKSDLDFEDAKFMLISCSAFVNLLKARSA